VESAYPGDGLVDVEDGGRVPDQYLPEEDQTIGEQEGAHDAPHEALGADEIRADGVPLCGRRQAWAMGVCMDRGWRGRWGF
jgi:hypothetical protein